MNHTTRTIIVILATAILWLPYYAWGVGTGNKLLAQGRIVLSSLIVCATASLGLIGLYYLQHFLMFDRSMSTANFRLLLILSTQLTAITLIAIDSHFNWKAILAGFFVLIGAVIGTYAIE